MKDKLEEAIKALAVEAEESTESIDAMHYSQAVLNLVNARRALGIEGT